MNYRILSAGGTRINITCEDNSEIDEALELIFAISAEYNGKVVMIGPHNNVFEITNEPMRLRFQWIANQGLIVIVHRETEIEKTVDLLKKHIDNLNQMTS